MLFPSRRVRDSTNCISIAWVKALGDMLVVASDGKIGMRSKEAGDCVMCSHVVLKQNKAASRGVVGREAQRINTFSVAICRGPSH